MTAPIAAVAEEAAPDLIAGRLVEQAHQFLDDAVPAAGWLPVTDPSAIPVRGW